MGKKRSRSDEAKHAGSQRTDCVNIVMGKGMRFMSSIVGPNKNIDRDDRALEPQYYQLESLAVANQ